MMKKVGSKGFLEVCDIQGGTQPPKKVWVKTKKENYVRMLQIRDFTQPEKDNIEFVPENPNLKKCKSDDILIGRYGASIGKILTGLEGAYNVAIVKTIPNLKKLDKRYLYYFLNTKYFQHFIRNTGSRAAQAGFNKSDLEKLKIPLPPLKTQKSIAARLDQAEAVKQLNQQLLAKYDALAQSVFLEMFGDPVVNEKGWEKIKLGEIEKISSGSTPSRNNKNNFGGDIPWVKTGEVNGKIIFETEESISKKGFENSSCRLYPKNSLIIAMYGQGKTRGQVGVLGIEATTNQACAVIPFSDKINFKFLFELLKINYEDLRRLGRGGNQPNLNVGLIKNYEIINPPLPLQTEFARRIENIEHQKSLLRLEMAKSEELFESLLQESFTSPHSPL